MPFVSVEIVGDPEYRAAGLAQALADACSPAFPPEHREVWVRVRSVPLLDWAVTSNSPPRPLPVFVHVVREENPGGDPLRREIQGLTAAVARVTGRPVDAVVVEYAPSGRGRLAFAGKLLE